MDEYTIDLTKYDETGLVHRHRHPERDAQGRIGDVIELERHYKPRAAPATAPTAPYSRTSTVEALAQFLADGLEQAMTDPRFSAWPVIDMQVTVPWVTDDELAWLKQDLRPSFDATAKVFGKHVHARWWREPTPAGATKIAPRVEVCRCPGRRA